MQNFLVFWIPRRKWDLVAKCTATQWKDGALEALFIFFRPPSAARGLFPSSSPPSILSPRFSLSLLSIKHEMTKRLKEFPDFSPSLFSLFPLPPQPLTHWTLWSLNPHKNEQCSSALIPSCVVLHQQNWILSHPAYESQITIIQNIVDSRSQRGHSSAILI